MQPSSNRKLLIAFDVRSISSAGWLAGDHYLRNLFVALRSLDSDQRPEIALLVANQPQSDGHTLTPYVDRLLEVPPDPLWFRLWKRLCASFRLTKRLMPRSPLATYLRKHQVDCVFVQGEFGPGLGIPLLSWIVDFQHVRMPSMFSPKEVQGRNEFFARIAERADRVILSSRDALRDFQCFAPRSAHKARVLSFVAHIPEGIFDSHSSDVCSYYHLPQRFVYLPNQFWKHKNHGTVIQALSLVKDQHLDITVVCTGSTSEVRDSLYFSNLLSAISERDLRNNLTILGMVPHNHVFQLMRQSLAVLQPSLFEGRSTTVEEAKSVGKSVILSDIPVHREQDPPDAVYFDPHDPEALAVCLVRAFRERKPGPDYELEAIARERLPKRIDQFGRTFYEIAREVVPR